VDHHSGSVASCAKALNNSHMSFALRELWQKIDRKFWGDKAVDRLE
jgi:hypothetical protein